jgi:hypothetical protein
VSGRRSYSYAEVAAVLFFVVAVLGAVWYALVLLADLAADWLLGG